MRGFMTIMRAAARPGVKRIQTATGHVWCKETAWGRPTQIRQAMSYNAQREGMVRLSPDIVSSYHLDMLRLAYVICGERALAEDAVQNAWHRAWRKLDQVRDPGALKGWLLAIAGNEARRAASKRARRHAESSSVASMPANEDIADLVIGRADLRVALARLDPLDRQIIALRYLSGAPAAQIGGEVGLSAEGARTRLSRALKKLRQELADG